MSIKDEFKRGWQRDVNALLERMGCPGAHIERTGQEQRERDRNRQARRSGMKTGSIILVIILGLYGCARIYSNEQAKNNPPASCQLLGGHWDIWKGWRC